MTTLKGLTLVTAFFVGGEADVRIAMLTAKLKLLGEPPHTL